MTGSFVIHNQYVKDFSFENPKAPSSFNIEKAPEFNLSLDVNVNAYDKSLFEVILAVEVKAVHENDTLFIISLAYAGMFTVEIEDRETLQRVLMVNCPQLLFPYVRQIVSQTTQNGGYLPLNMHPIDFVSLYEKKLAEGSEQAPANDAKN